MNIQDQRYNVDRMLGERMLRHADTLIRSWAHELDEIEYFARLDRLAEQYDQIWKAYLTESIQNNMAGEDIQNAMNRLTYRYYTLSDEIYDRLRLKNGLAPTMVGFGKDNVESITNYFAQNVHRKDEDLDWLYEISQDEDKQGTAIAAVAALAANLRTGFHEASLLTLLDIAELANPVADQALAQAIHVTGQYDIRMDFFNQIGDRWLSLLEKKSEVAQAAIEAIIEQTEGNEQLTETWIFGVVCDTDQKRVRAARAYLKKDMREQAFDGCLMNRTDICGEDDELRADMLLYDDLWDEAMEVYQQIELNGGMTPQIRFRAGWCALLTGDYETAERYMIARLRDTKHVRKEDYINYGHLCWLKGDRVTAYENYREARRLCGTIKEWKESFCPDRKVISQLGIPLDEVYMMEDRLLKL